MRITDLKTINLDNGGRGGVSITITKSAVMLFVEDGEVALTPALIRELRQAFEVVEANR